MFSARSSGSSRTAQGSARSFFRSSSKASEMYLRKMSPRTTHRYSAASILPRRASPCTTTGLRSRRRLRYRTRSCPSKHLFITIMRHRARTREQQGRPCNATTPPFACSICLAVESFSSSEEFAKSEPFSPGSLQRTPGGGSPPAPSVGPPSSSAGPAPSRGPSLSRSPCGCARAGADSAEKHDQVDPVGRKRSMMGRMGGSPASMSGAMASVSRSMMRCLYLRRRSLSWHISFNDNALPGSAL